jgi:membrane-associated phospholipid phosphatase
MAVWFSFVYLGHHYVVDVLGGIVFAVGAYLFTRGQVFSRFAARLAALGTRRPTGLPR